MTGLLQAQFIPVEGKSEGGGMALQVSRRRIASTDQVQLSAQPGEAVFPGFEWPMVAETFVQQCADRL